MPAGGTCPKVLIVEDDADQRQLICDALRIHYAVRDGPSSANIQAVASGQECLGQDLAAYDVVLLDYDLADMSGISVLKGILSRADLPVIFITGHNDTATATEAIAQGAQDYIVKLGDYLFAIPVVVDKAMRQHAIKKENQVLQQELRAMLDELKEKNRQLRESLQKVEALATTDHLTGLANRRRFKDVLERSYNEAVRYGFDLSCCMCDLDHFKQFNDTLGHLVGDEVLMLAADIIRSSLRSTDMAARYGGDEFVLLLPHTGIEMAQAVCNRVRVQFLTDERFFKQNRGLAAPVTLSAGVSSLNVNHPSSADELVSLADRALYTAKERGKNRIVVFGARQEVVISHQ